MSSNPYSTIIQYNPVPARVWSRVQNPCSIIAYENDDPAANTDFSRADYERQMLLKGNVLQYKKNSSNLTKKQRYTQIAKGMWTNRTKTWATQSDTYSNPNMTSLLRVNYTTLDPSNNTFSNRSNPFGCPINEIQNGGNLVCNVVVDPCTQEVIKRTKSQQLCNPTTDSDVPGQIQDLCWNDGTQTWYPRQRYIMPTSGTKWPVGYKPFVSALTPAAPILTLESINADSITLSWTVINSQCIPISSFNIYQNNVLVENVLYPINTVKINITYGKNEFNVTSLSSNIESDFSNDVEFTSDIADAPAISYTTCYKQITLNWTDSDPTITSYNIYKDTDAAINVSSSTFTWTFTGLTNGTTYSLNVKAVNTNGESTNSPINVPLPDTYTYFTGWTSYTKNTTYTYLQFSIPNGELTGSLVYTCPTSITTASVLIVGGGGGGGGGWYSSNTDYGGGGGGGGGEIINVNPITITNLTTINVKVGTRGSGGGAGNTDGYNGTTSNISGTYSYVATFGSGGKKGQTGTGGLGGGSGSTAGGNGGNQPSGSGVGSTYGTYSGGGGSGNGYIGFGGKGGNGIGGTGGTYAVDGQEGIAFGSGGGGGGASYVYEGIGASGNQGVVIFTIPN